jgi:hypothetical protein
MLSWTPVPSLVDPLDCKKQNKRCIISSVIIFIMDADSLNSNLNDTGEHYITDRLSSEKMQLCNRHMLALSF